MDEKPTSFVVKRTKYRHTLESSQLGSRLVIDLALLITRPTSWLNHSGLRTYCRGVLIGIYLFPFCIANPIFREPFSAAELILHNKIQFWLVWLHLLPLLTAYSNPSDCVPMMETTTLIHWVWIRPCTRDEGCITNNHTSLARADDTLYPWWGRLLTSASPTECASNMWYILHALNELM